MRGEPVPFSKQAPLVGNVPGNFEESNKFAAVISAASRLSPKMMLNHKVSHGAVAPPQDGDGSVLNAMISWSPGFNVTAFAGQQKTIKAKTMAREDNFPNVPGHR